MFGCNERGVGALDNEGCLVTREGDLFFGSHSHEQGASVIAAAEFSVCLHGRTNPPTLKTSVVIDQEILFTLNCDALKMIRHIKFTFFHKLLKSPCC